MHRQQTRDGAMAWRWTGPVGFNGDPPEPRCSHSCTLVDDDLFIIGGGRIVGESRPLAFVHFAPVHRLSLRTMTWSRAVPEAEGGMAARRGHSAALHEPSGRIVVFGGVVDEVDVAGSACAADTWVLHTAGQAAMYDGEYAAFGVTSLRPATQRQ